MFERLEPRQLEQLATMGFVADVRKMLVGFYPLVTTDYDRTQITSLESGNLYEIQKEAASKLNRLVEIAKVEPDCRAILKEFPVDNYLPESGNRFADLGRLMGHSAQFEQFIANLRTIQVFQKNFGE
jgi:hypothetical protein